MKAWGSERDFVGYGGNALTRVGREAPASLRTSPRITKKAPTLPFADGDGTMIVAMKAPAQAARKAIPATGALLLRMADQDSSAVDQTPFTTDWKIAAGIAPSATAWIGPVSERAA